MSSKDLLAGEFMNEDEYRRHEEMCNENRMEGQEIKDRVKKLPEDVQDEVFALLTKAHKMYDRQIHWHPVLNPKKNLDISEKEFNVALNDICMRVINCRIFK